MIATWHKIIMQSYVLVFTWPDGRRTTTQHVTMIDALEHVEQIKTIFDFDLGPTWSSKLVGGLGVIIRDKFTIEIETVEHTAPETVEEAVDPYFCYVLMRTDVPDPLNGKMAAQSHHAGTKMVMQAYQSKNFEMIERLEEWADDTQDGFGTCIVLGVTAPEMYQATSLATLMGLDTGIVLDPTYPIRDGRDIQTLPIKTCAYVFGRKSKCFPILGKFPLLKTGADE